MRVERLIQLDAQHLDDTFVTMLEEQQKRIFSYLQPSWTTNFAPELDLALRAAVFGLTVGANTASPGSQLMGLTYRNERANSAKHSRSMMPLSTAQRLLMCIGSVLLPYFLRRVELRATEHEWSARHSAESWRMRLIHGMRQLSKVYTVLSTLNLMAFLLLDGKYRSPIELLLGTRLVPQQRHGARGSMPFDFLNQQLIFHGITEFVRWAVPVVSSGQATLSQVWHRLVQYSESSGGRAVNVDTLDPSSWSQSCSVCEASPPVMGFISSCGHIGCYVCLKTALMTDPNPRCSRCNAPLGNMKRFESHINMET